jgi:predicted DNA-binding transcriptional regulator YafY
VLKIKTAMNRIDRLTAILIQLQTKKWVTASEIAERYDISHRTVYRDIRALEEAGVPLGSEAGRGYFIVDGYHLPPVMFTLNEAGAMLIAGKLVNKLTDPSVSKSYLCAIDKIKSILPSKEKDTVEEMDSQIEVFQGRPVYEDRENFMTLIQQALREGKCIKISYHAFYSSEHTSNRVIDPLGLVYYGNAWHLIGFCKLRNEMRDFRTDRITHLEKISECASEKKAGDLQRYFQNLWQITNLLEVRVWFEASLAAALDNVKFYFGFINEHLSGDGVVMTFAVEDFNYIANWLLSFHDRVKIVHPQELKKLVVEKVRSLASLYLQNSKVDEAKT